LKEKSGMGLQQNHWFLLLGLCCFKSLSLSLSLCMFTFCFPSESDYDDDRESCGIFPFLPRVNVREESCLSVFKEVIEILLLLSDFHFHQWILTFSPISVRATPLLFYLFSVCNVFPIITVAPILCATLSRPKYRL